MGGVDEATEARRKRPPPPLDPLGERSVLGPGPTTSIFVVAWAVERELQCFRRLLLRLYLS